LAREFKLPDIGEGVHEGEVVKWYVKEGDSVKENDPVVEVMTDKVTVQIPSPVTGKILERRAKEGEVVKVGSTLVVFGEAGEVATPSPAKSSNPPPPPVRASAPPPQASGGDVLAAPAVRRLARELRVSLAAVRGSGPQGRVTEDDVRRAAQAPAAVPKPAVPVESLAAPGRPGEERISIHGLRRRIFEKMAKSNAMAAPFTYVEEVDMSQLVHLRDHLNESADRKGTKLTFLPFFIKAVVAALKEFPTLNASVDDERGDIVVKRYYHIGIATATDEGLTVTVVHEADGKDLWYLAKEVERLSNAAREKRLTLEEVQGSTFTITSLGKEGGVLATPIINWPEVAILGIHKIEKRPVVRKDQIVVRDMMYLSCSFDHRVIDGHIGAAFVQAIRNYLEHPALLFVGLE
jgi:pyruvate dehydrogenase E2 component (dihydrolipoamide acetyltransferase)